jgi:hypothetical protein
MGDRAALRARLRGAVAVLAYGALGIGGLAVALTAQALFVGGRTATVWRLVLSRLLIPVAAVIGASVVGVALADRVGVSSCAYDAVGPAESTDGPCQGLGFGVLTGLGLGLVVLGYNIATGGIGDPMMGAAKVTIVSIGRLLYLGLAEEIVLRWGGVSLLAGFGLAWFRSGDVGASRRSVGWAAIVVVATAVAIAPVVTGQDPITAISVARFMINLVPGIVFGGLFWRFNLETAMVAHVSAHLPHLVLSLLL